MFKYYDKTGHRLQVKCPVCGEVNTLQHLKTHLGMAPPPLQDKTDTRIAYLGELSRLATPLTSTVR